jgi:hypothetical protein
MEDRLDFIINYGINTGWGPSWRRGRKKSFEIGNELCYNNYRNYVLVKESL